MIDNLENINILIYDATPEAAHIQLEAELLSDEEFRVHLTYNFIIESVYYTDNLSYYKWIALAHDDKLTLVDYIYNNIDRIGYSGYTKEEAHGLLTKMKLAHYFNGDTNEKG